MTSLRLYSGPLSMFGAKAEIATREKGLEFELVMVPFEMKRLYQPKHPEVVRINPKRQVPVLIHGDARDVRFDPDLRVPGGPGTHSRRCGRPEPPRARGRAGSSTSPTRSTSRTSSA